MDDALGFLAMLGLWLLAFLLLVSYWLWHVAAQAADSFVSAATQAAVAAVPHEPNDSRTCEMHLDDDTIAAAASSADAAVARLTSPRFSAVVTESPDGGAGLAGIWRDDCKLYIAVTVKPLGAKFAVLDARAARCVDFAADTPRPCPVT